MSIHKRSTIAVRPNTNNNAIVATCGCCPRSWRRGSSLAVESSFMVKRANSRTVATTPNEDIITKVGSAIEPAPVTVEVIVLL
jgi:hypothetical protein